jgi:hypothetical protein
LQKEVNKNGRPVSEITVPIFAAIYGGSILSTTYYRQKLQGENRNDDNRSRGNSNSDLYACWDSRKREGSLTTTIDQRGKGANNSW